jgi:hypothetical protein
VEECPNFKTEDKTVFTIKHDKKINLKSTVTRTTQWKIFGIPFRCTRCSIKISSGLALLGHAGYAPNDRWHILKMETLTVVLPREARFGKSQTGNSFQSC